MFNVWLSACRISRLMRLCDQLSLYFLLTGIPGTMRNGSRDLPRLTHMAYITLAEKED